MKHIIWTELPVGTALYDTKFEIIYLLVERQGDKARWFMTKSLATNKSSAIGHLYTMSPHKVPDSFLILGYAK